MKKILTAIILLGLISCEKNQENSAKQDAPQHNLTDPTLTRDSEALFLTGAPEQIQSRHVWISKHTDLGKDGDIPVHICYRNDEKDSWKLRGTGTILAQHPNYIFSAYHVFDEDKGQFAYRKIGVHELSRNSQFDGYIAQPQLLNHVNDSIICPTVKDNPSSIFIPKSTKATSEWIGTKNYKTTIFSKIARFSTYPEIPIHTVAMVEFEEGVYYVLLNWEVYPGESGTLVTIDGAEGKLVLICGQSIPFEIVQALPKDQQLALNWSPLKLYAMCNWVNVK